MNKPELDIRPIRQFLPGYRKPSEGPDFGSAILGKTESSLDLEPVGEIFRQKKDNRIGNSPINHGTKIRRPKFDNYTSTFNPANLQPIKDLLPIPKQFPLPKGTHLLKLKQKLHQANPLDQLSFGVRKFINELHQSVIPSIVEGPMIDYISQLALFIRSPHQDRSDLNSYSNDQSTGNLLLDHSDHALSISRARLRRIIGEDHLARLDKLVNNNKTPATANLSEANMDTLCEIFSVYSCPYKPK